MEEFLLSNRTINALENPVSIKDIIMGVLQQLQQPNTKRMAGILTWLQAYMTVMAAKCHNLVGPMISHMNIVMQL